jgi:hypothetical protein
MKTKIVQIACDEYRLFALSEDGDVWHLDEGYWRKFPSLPVEAAQSRLPSSFAARPRPKRHSPKPKPPNTADLQAAARAG